MREDLRILLGLYFSTSASSIVMNAYLNEKNHQEAKKKALKKLVYKKGLCSEARKELSLIKQEHFFDMASDLLSSLVPFKNVYVTCSNIGFDKEMGKFIEEVYDEIITNVNEIEDEYRKNNVEMIKSVRDSLSYMPSNINLDDEETRLTTRETKKILKMNKINYRMIVNNFDKEREA